MSRWDSVRANKRRDPGAKDRTCLRCRKTCSPRYLYCSDLCSDQSRAEVRESRLTAKERQAS